MHLGGPNLGGGGVLFPSSSQGLPKVLQDVPNSFALLSYMLWPKLNLHIHMNYKGGPRGSTLYFYFGGVPNVLIFFADGQI
jgi:hypothetical protein